jgi:hypothetical protein
MFLTEKVLEIAREVEGERPTKRRRGRPRRQPIIESDEENVDEVLDDSSSTLDDGIVMLVPRRRVLK